jgi:N-acetylglutamate synthase-like GNAT family acetyltransferase
MDRLKEIRYIPYKTNYFDQVRSLILGTIDQLNSKDYDPSTISIMRSWQSAERLTRKFSEGKYFLALDQDKVVGIGGLVGNEVCTMFVHPEYNGLGIGREILKNIENVARDSHLDKIALSSTITAEAFYTSCGFAKVKRAIHKLDGHDFEAIEMEKHLS